MEGKPNPPENRGLLPNAFQHIYDHVTLANTNQREKYLIRASYFEIYNEEIRDLLVSSSQKKNTYSQTLELKESPDLGVYIKDLTSTVVKSVSEIDALLQVGKRNRSVAMTNMNAESSRSHSVFTVVIECSYVDDRGEEHIRVGKLNLVDLAGSERQGKTLATGDRLKEAANINLSLSALGNVISALVDGKSQHIPYRDSKLTRILQDSLGGNTKTVMCANVGPADYNYSESLSTLRYANRAKNIKNKPIINEDPKDAVIREFQEEIARLRAQLSQMPSQGVVTAGQPIKAEISDQNNPHEAVILKEMKQRLDSQTAQMEERSKVRMEQLRQEKDKTAEERRILQIKLERERLDRAETDQQRILLEKKLADMENKLILGGQVADKAAKQEAALRKAEQDLVARRENELALARQMAEKVESQLELEDRYTSLNDEVQVKTRKLKKASEKLRQAKSEIKDLQAEFQTERDELLETIRNLNKQMKLKELIITQFIPPEFRAQFDDVAFGGRAVWNEEEERWFIPKINPLNPSTNAAFSVGPFQSSDEKLLRPETEYARVQRVKDPTNVRFRSQNIIDLELDRRIPLNQIHNGSGQVSSKVSEILKMKIGDGSLNKIRPERDFPNNPYLHYRPKTSAKS
jgi:hypothetical protein